MSDSIKFPPKLEFLFKTLMPDGITPIRYKVAYGGRGGGKTENFASALVTQGAQRPLRVLCARQLQNSIDESVHKTLEEMINRNNLSHLYTVKKSYILGPNGTEFFFEGIQHNTSKIKSYQSVDICWVEEANAVTESSWKLLTPTIRKPNSEIWISFNPELEVDYTYQRFVVKPSNDTWSEYINWRDNPWFPDVLLKEMMDMRESDYEGYLNVWEGKCRQMLDGVVYRNELQKADLEGRIRKVYYDHTKLVDTFWDIGFSDMTAIWFIQRVNNEFRVLDFYQCSGKALPHYINILKKKGYVYGIHHLPHDAGNKNAAALATGKTIAQTMREFEVSVKVLPRLGIADGINATRMIFPQCVFDEERTREGVQCLRHYRYDVDADSKLMSRLPLHDQYSHAADAFRYFGISSKEPRHLRGAVKLKNEARKIASRLGLGEPEKAHSSGWLGG